MSELISSFLLLLYILTLRFPELTLSEALISEEIGTVNEFV